MLDIARVGGNCYILGAMPKCAVYLDMRDNGWWRTGRDTPEQVALNGVAADALCAGQGRRIRAWSRAMQSPGNAGIKAYRGRAPVSGPEQG